MRPTRATRPPARRPARSRSSANARRMTCALNAPASPRSAVTTTMATRRTSSRRCRSGRSGGRRPRAPCRPSAPASGRRTGASPRCRVCARRSRAPATSSIAFVILRVLRTERIRRLMSWSEAMRLDEPASPSTLKPFLNFSISRVQLLGELVGQVARLADLLVGSSPSARRCSRSSSWNRGDLRRRDVVEVAVDAGVDRRRPAPRSATASTAAGSASRPSSRRG